LSGAKPVNVASDPKSPGPKCVGTNAHVVSDCEISGIWDADGVTGFCDGEIPDLGSSETLDTDNADADCNETVPRLGPLGISDADDVKFDSNGAAPDMESLEMWGSGDAGSDSSVLGLVSSGMPGAGGVDVDSGGTGSTLESSGGIPDPFPVGDIGRHESSG